MTLVLKQIRKVAVIGWSTDTILGEEADLIAGDQKKRTVANDGESNLFFPMDYTGSVSVTVKGSEGGEDTGTINIT